MDLTARQRAELLALMAVAAVVASLETMAGHFSLVSAPRPIWLYAYDNGDRWSELSTGVSSTVGPGWQSTDRGLRLASKQAGDIAVRVPGDPRSRLLLFMDGAGRDPVSLVLTASPDGRAFREIARTRLAPRTRIDLTPFVGAFDTVWLNLRLSSEPTTSAHDDFVVSRIQIERLAPPFRLPDLPLISLLILTPPLAYLTRVAARRSHPFLFALAVLGGLSALAAMSAASRDDSRPWWFAVADEHDSAVYLLLPYLLLLILLGWRTRAWNDLPPLRSIWTGFALAGTLAWAGHLRLVALKQSGWTTPEPDVLGYIQLAAAMTSPYDTGLREPLWVWVVKAWRWAAGDDLLAIRLLTILISLGLIVTAYRFFHDYTGHPLPGLLVAVLLSTNPYLISLSIRGLRDEAYATAVLWAAYFVLVRRTNLSPRGQAIGLAVSGAAAQLLRINSYLFLVPLLLLWSRRQRLAKPLYVLLPLAFITAVSIPHLVHSSRTFGDAMYFLNVHNATWARNNEFLILKQTTCGGCPSRDEFLRHPYAGSPITAREYLFGMHSLPELAEIVGRGYLRLYLTPTDLFATQTGTGSALGYGLYLIGLGLILSGPYREIPALIIVLANMTPFAVMVGVEARAMIHTAPYVSFVLAYAVFRLLTKSLGLMDANRRHDVADRG